MRASIFAYGLACYGLFLAVFLYLVAFVCDLPGPFLGVELKTVSAGDAGAPLPALLVDLALLLLFGLQHSVMPRAGFKRWLTSWMPAPMERSTYVLATSLVLMLIFACWQPLPGMLWSATAPALVATLWGLNALGWGLVLLATFLTNHFDLFGLRQIWLNLVGTTYGPVPFREILLYRWIRHPMMLGLFIAFWAWPTMTMSHFVFSLGMSVYILVGVHFEERGLRRELGQPYRDYAARTGRFLPRWS